MNQTDVFPNLQQGIGAIPNISVLDLAYYPKERGMYNYEKSSNMNDDGTFTNPTERWVVLWRPNHNDS